MTNITLGYGGTGDDAPPMSSDDEDYEMAVSQISTESTDLPATVLDDSNDETKNLKEEMAPSARKASSRELPHWAQIAVQVEEAKTAFEESISESKNGRSYKMNYTLLCCLI